jgi:ribonuclease Z
MEAWRQEWNIPGTQWTLRGFSRAAYRTGFTITELNIMLDAGPQYFGKPDHIFITHTHGDHIAQLPFTLINDEDSQHIFHIYAPTVCEKWLRQYINALFDVNALRHVKEIPDRYVFHPVEPHTEFPVTVRNNPHRVEIFECDHGIPTVSYGIKVVRNRLKDEYKELPGKEIGLLRKQGVEVTREVVIPTLAFLCDTTIRVFELNPSVFNYPTIMIECTFLRQEDVNNSKHICWNELKPVILSHPENMFVLIHFSMKYKDEEIKTFFEGEGVSNIKVWVE